MDHSNRWKVLAGCTEYLGKIFVRCDFCGTLISFGTRCSTKSNVQGTGEKEGKGANWAGGFKIYLLSRLRQKRLRFRKRGTSDVSQASTALRQPFEFLELWWQCRAQSQMVIMGHWGGPLRRLLSLFFAPYLISCRYGSMYLSSLLMNRSPRAFARVPALTRVNYSDTFILTAITLQET